MKHIPARKVAAAALTLTLAAAPAFAFAQTTSTTTPNSTISTLEAQIKSLMQQLATLRSQAHGDQGEGSSTPEMPNMLASSSMPMHIACPMPVRNLGVGAYGDDVKELQQFLSQQSSSTLPTNAVTGFFGPMTQQALEKFQMNNGISSTGTLGPITRNLFARRCAIGHENSTGNWDHSSTTSAWPMTGSSSPMMPYMHMGSTTNMHPMIPAGWFNVLGSSTQSTSFSQSYSNSEYH